MRDAPSSAGRQAGRECAQVARLRHRRVEPAPHQGREREIAGDQHNAVHQHAREQPDSRGKIPQGADPVRRGPHRVWISPSPSAQMTRPDAAALAARTKTRRSSFIQDAEQPLGEMPEAFAKRDVGGLDGEGIQRPEAAFQPVGAAAAMQTRPAPRARAAPTPAPLR